MSRRWRQVGNRRRPPRNPSTSDARLLRALLPSAPPVCWGTPVQRHRRPLVLVPKRDASLAKIVRGELDAHLVAGQDPDAMLAHLAGHISDDAVTVLESDAKACVGHDFADHPFHFDRVFFRHPYPLVDRYAERGEPKRSRLAARRSERLQVRGRVLAIGAALQFEGHLLVLAQRGETSALYGGNVDENVLRAVVGLNEAEALCVVEELDGSVGHDCSRMWNRFVRECTTHQIIDRGETAEDRRK